MLIAAIIGAGDLKRFGVAMQSGALQQTLHGSDLDAACTRNLESLRLQNISRH